MKGSLSLNSIQQLAKEGNESALVTLAVLYTQGRGLPIDYAQAKILLREAIAKYNSAPAALLLISVLQEENACKAEDFIALNKLAINGGYSEAQFGLAKSLLYGQYSEKDEKEALRLLQQGADNDNIYCMVFLANLYDNGSFVTCNKEKAKMYYLKAAKMGNIEASEWLLNNGFEPLPIFNLYNELKKLPNAEKLFMRKLLEDRMSPFKTSFVHISKYGKIHFWQYSSDSECSWEPQITALFLFFLRHNQGVTSQDIRTIWREEICTIYYITKHQNEITEVTDQENTSFTFQNIYDTNSWEKDQKIKDFYNEISQKESNRINEIVSNINKCLKKSFTNIEVAKHFYVQNIDSGDNKMRLIKVPRKWITCEDGCFSKNFFNLQPYDGSNTFDHLEVNIDTSNDIFKRMAESGDMFAQYYWGTHLLNSKKPENKKEGFEFIKKSSEQEYEYALREMGVFYSDGQYVNKDYKTALKYYERSGIAFDEMGLLYDKIWDNPRKAQELYKLGIKELHMYNARLDCMFGYSNIMWEKLINSLQIEPKNQKEQKNCDDNILKLIQEIVLMDVPLALHGYKECQTRLKDIVDIDKLLKTYKIAQTMNWKQIELSFNLLDKCNTIVIKSLSFINKKLVLSSEMGKVTELCLKKKTLALYILFLKHKEGLNRESMDIFFDSIKDRTSNPQNHNGAEKPKSNIYYDELLILYSYFKKNDAKYGDIDEICCEAVHNLLDFGKDDFIRVVSEINKGLKMQFPGANLYQQLCIKSSENSFYQVNVDRNVVNLDFL